MVRGNIIPNISKILWDSNPILNAPFMVGTLREHVSTTPMETVLNLEGQMVINLLLQAEDVIVEDDMLGEAMVAIAMATAKALPQKVNIIFKWRQSCLLYQINL
jgi:hypothetical protein